MAKDEFSQLRAFLEVARERSFTRAAKRLGVTRSALSHTVRSLEDRLGVRLLSRTTRDVAPTAAGERLLGNIEPHFKSISDEISAIAALRDKPTGQIRIVCPDDAVDLVFRPRLPSFLRNNPEIEVELIVDNGLTNIVESQFDAGLRLGEAIAKDMVAVRVGPDFRYAVVGSPLYFADQPAPATPRDLGEHNCINLRLPTSGGIYEWEFEEDGREFTVAVEGQLTVSLVEQAIDAALDHVGLAYVPLALCEPHINSGRLQEALAAWCPEFQGYHLYYPSRRNHSRAFSVFVQAFRHHAEGLQA